MRNHGGHQIDLGSYIVDPAQALKKLWDIADLTASPDYNVVKTGVSWMDEITYAPGQSALVVARPGMGKSLFLQSVCLKLIREMQQQGSGGVVLYVTLEEPSHKLALKLAGYGDLWRGLIRGEQRVVDFKNSTKDIPLKTSNLRMVEYPGIVAGRMSPAVSPSILLRTIEHMVGQYGRKVNAVFLDYAQLLRSDDLGSSARVQDHILEVSHGLVKIKHALACPLFIAVQAGRASEQRGDRIPTLSDLQQSCVTGDTSILLSDGTSITAADLHARVVAGEPVRVASMLDIDSDELPTTHGASDVVASVRRAPERVLELATSCGHSIRATDNHPFVTPSGWVSLGALSAGDWVGLPSVAAVDRCDGSIGTHRSFWLGMMIGDGCMLPGRGPFLANHEGSVLDAYESAGSVAWGSEFVFRRRINTPSALTTKPCYVSIIARADGRKLGPYNRVVKWLDSVGARKKGPVKTIPNIPMSQEECVAMLSGLLLTDGSFGDRSCRFCTTSIALARQVQTIGTRFGAPSSLRTSRAGSLAPLWRETNMTYIVDWGGRSAETICSTVIPWLAGKKLDAARRLLASSSGSQKKRKSREDLLPEFFCRMAISASVGNRERFNMVKGRGISRARLLEAGEFSGDTKCVAAAQSRITWTKVKSIEAMPPEETYDIQVANTKNFIANGIIVHNSALEQDADAIIALRRPIVDSGDDPEVTIGNQTYTIDKNLIVGRILKARQDGCVGRTGGANFDPVSLACGDLTPEQVQRSMPSVGASCSPAPAPRNLSYAERQDMGDTRW